MNSYKFEVADPDLVDGGLTNLVRRTTGWRGYSYVFDGESGYLDHALATPSLDAQVSGVATGTSTPTSRSRSTTTPSSNRPQQVDSFYSPEAFRASDHDPVLIGVALGSGTDGECRRYLHRCRRVASLTLTASGTGQGLSPTHGISMTTARPRRQAQTATFSASTIDGPATGHVRVRVSDGEVSAVSSATVQVTNVAPTATFAAPASVFAGFTIALALSGPVDPSAADRTAGFTYAFDCGDGVFVDASGPSASCSTNDTGSRAVRGRITDKDGGSSTYRATVTVVVTAASLCDLATAYQPKDGVANSLCAKLAQGSLDAFINEVAAQVGKTLTSEQAATLTRLAKRL